MTDPMSSMPPKASPWARWGPVAAIVVVVAVIAAVVIIGGGDDGEDTAAGPDGTGGGDTSSGVPINYFQAEEEGTVDDYTWVDNCDLETGRLQIPTVYAPPCVPAFEGDNGGATSKGVTEDTIRVAFYQPPPNADLTAALGGRTDEPEVAMETRRAYVAMFNDLYETYGRRVELIQFDGTGEADDETAAVADAREVAQDLDVFASIGGPALTSAYAEELADQGVLCIGCSASSPDSKFQENAPYWWNTQATAEQYLLTVGDLTTGQLLGGTAEFAGDESMHDQERVFGTAHFEQDVPVFEEVTAEAAERGAEAGFENAVTEAYNFDLATMPQRAASIIAKMKEAGVTTIIFLGDPIMPIYLTEAATAQDYYPEWIVTGTVLTDTSALARLYDQTQWANAFGVSQLSARAPREQGDSWRLHEWYYGETPVAENTQGVVYAPVSLLMLGIYAAGEDLTPEHFRDGLFNIPPRGGGILTPQISFGDQAGFEDPDFAGTDDMTVIWYDADEVGVDEQGQEGPGMYRYVEGGRRYLAGEMEPGSIRFFDEEGTVTVYEESPDPDDIPPDYPSPEQGAGCPPTGCQSQ